MSYYIEDQVTGLVDGYYVSKNHAQGVADGLNLMTREHLFLVKPASERNKANIVDAEFLGNFPWFIEMVTKSCPWLKEWK